MAPFTSYKEASHWALVTDAHGMVAAGGADLAEGFGGRQVGEGGEMAFAGVDYGEVEGARGGEDLLQGGDDGADGGVDCGVAALSVGVSGLRSNLVEGLS